MSQLFENFESARARPRPEIYKPPVEVTFAPQAWTSAIMMDLTGPYAYALDLPAIAECLVGNLLMNPAAEQMIDRGGKRAPETPDTLALRLQDDGIYFLGDMLPARGHVMAFFLKPETDTRPSELIVRGAIPTISGPVAFPRAKAAATNPINPHRKIYPAMSCRTYAKPISARRSNFLAMAVLLTKASSITAAPYCPPL